MENLIRKEVKSLSPYVAGKPIDEVKREYGIERVVKLASNENPYGCSQAVKKVINELVDETNLYPDAASHDLKEEIAKTFNVDKDMVFCGAGSDSLIKDICLTILNEGDESIMGEITFPRYESNTLLMGAKPIKIPMKDNKLDIQGMVDAITDKTKVIWFCNPNNPTGTIFTEEEFLALIDRIPKSVLIVMDEAYEEFVQSDKFPNTLELMKTHNNIILLKTFSKAYGLASLRIGYGIGEINFVQYLNRVINAFDSNLYGQKAATEALKDKEFLKYVIENNEIQREYLKREFKKLGLKYLDTHANFIMVNVNGDDKKIHEYLLSKGFIIRPGFLLGMPGWIRVSIGLEGDNREFVELLEEAIEYRNNN
ncbi:histidinol-phosphate transaminase [Clostridium sardiniense]|uniref:histidinol-phosphate transaminase n=1 Tax=Clostridium sardiniense TaxID=29369 RepID=UPI003D326CFF